jgi:uncharacterized protein (UPF0333 family)
MEIFELKAIIEGFYILDKIKHHEIGFYYMFRPKQEIKLPKNYFELMIEDIQKENVQPKIIYNLISSENKGIMHFSIKDIKI